MQGRETDGWRAAGSLRTVVDLRDGTLAFLDGRVDVPVRRAGR